MAEQYLKDQLTRSSKYTETYDQHFQQAGANYKGKAIQPLYHRQTTNSIECIE